MRRRALAAGAVALTVAGCGASSSRPGSLRAQAARVCARAQAQGTEIKPPAGAAQTAAFLRRGMAVLGPELTALRGLRVPPAQSGAYSTAVGALAGELALLATATHDLDHGADPLTEIKVLQRRLAPAEGRADAAWRTLGVPACVGR